MDERSGEDADDLDIVSIGSLYVGLWDKKYWSCSRGKDRYPYPVGYHALRANGGVTYNLEVREGNKGPLFMVTSTSGDSSSGQTPDIAWECFQKKSGPRVKNFNGKRFSCKVDGTELFGFRNPSVQRLLRELVVIVNPVPEKSLVYSSCQNISGTSKDIQEPESCIKTDSLKYSENQQHSRKRNIRHTGSVVNVSSVACIKRTQSQDLMSSEDIFSFKQRNAPNFEAGPSKDEVFHSEIPQSGTFFLKDASHLNISSDLLCLNAHVQNSIQHEPLEKTPLEVEKDFVLLVEDEPEQPGISLCFNGNNTKTIIHENSNPVHMENKSSMEEEVLDALLDSDLGAVTLAVKSNSRCLENSDGDANPKDLDLFVPDSLEISRGNTEGVTLENEKGYFLGMKYELATYVPVPQVTANCAYKRVSQSEQDIFRGREVQVDTPNARCSAREKGSPTCKCLLDNVSSSDFVKESLSTESERQTYFETELAGVTGQDLTRSMMTLLLPRAIPLLTKTYMRKRLRKQSQEISPVSDLDPEELWSSQKRHLTTKHINLQLEGTDGRIKAEETTVGASSVFQEVKDDSICRNGIKEQTNMSESAGVHPIVPDSFEDDLCFHDPLLSQPLSSYNGDVFAQDHKTDQEQADKNHVDEGNSVIFLSGSSPYHHHSLASNCSTCIISVKPRDGCLSSSDSYLQIVKPIHMDSIEDVATLEICNILHKGVHPPDVEENIHCAQMDVCSDESRKCRHDTKVNASIDDLFSTRDDRVTDTRNAADELHVSAVGIKLAQNTEGPFCSTTASALMSVGETQTNDGMAEKPPFVPHPIMNEVPHSDSIVCRDISKGEDQRTFSDRLLQINKNRQVETNVHGIGDEASLNERMQHLTTGNVSRSMSSLVKVVQLASQDREAAKSVSNEVDFFRPAHTCTADYVNHVDNLTVADGCCEPASLVQEVIEHPPGGNKDHNLINSDVNPAIESIASGKQGGYFNTELYKRNPYNIPLSKISDAEKEFEGFVEVVGCYLLPNTILSILLIEKHGAILVCALCGHSEEALRDLFIYMIPFDNQMNCPSFIGYTSMSFPDLKDQCGRRIPVESSGLQLTPHGESLVLLSCIKAPCCREKNLNCLCSICKLDHCEENAIKIVHVELGYVSIIAKLRTAGRIYCILVCEPYHLLAVEESGELHVWVMNPMWREKCDEFILSNFGHMSPSATVLKQILEAEAILEACSWEYFDRCSVVIESDALIVVNAIKETGPDLWKAGSILAKCHGRLKDSAASIVFCPRQANEAAHCLAKWALRSHQARPWSSSLLELPRDVVYQNFSDVDASGSTVQST